MHEYEKEDISECLNGQRLVFIGDSTVRQIFWAVAKKMGQYEADPEPRDVLDFNYKGEDIEIESGGVTARFIWDPWLNSTGLDEELEKYEARPITGGRDESAALILAGSPGLWYTRHSELNYFQEFRTSLDRVISHMDHTTMETDTLETKLFQSSYGSPNLLLLSPVQVPVYQSLSPGARATITYEKIQMVNEYLHQASAYSNADVVWSYSLMTETNKGQYTVGGINVVPSVAQQKADVLLNLRCNNDAAQKGYPYNRTCCTNYRPPNWPQRILLLIGTFLLPGILMLRQKHILNTATYLPPPDICNSMAVLALTLCFCFFADRTQLFEKSNAQYQATLFGGALLVAAIAGLCSIKRTLPSTVIRAENENVPDDEHLSQGQISDLKGATIVFLLACNYATASEVTWAYKTSRVMVASYLCITAYDHTLSFLSTNNYSPQHVAAVLLRLNLLSSMLPYIMRTENTFYYLPLLLSFWFIVNYLMLRAGAKYNSNINFVLAKIILSSMFTMMFITAPGSLEFISTALQYSCGITWDAKEWRSSASLDIYIPYVGMIAAASHWSSQLKASPLLPDHLTEMKRPGQTRNTLFQNFTAVITSVILVAIFISISRGTTTGEDYDQYHPYVSWIPILSIEMLRTSHPFIRSIHSRAFAWVGYCSIELYVLQHHIWLAGDSRGVLGIGLLNKWVERLVLTLLFLWVSHHAAEACRKLVLWIVRVRVHPEDKLRCEIPRAGRIMEPSGKSAVEEKLINASADTDRLSPLSRDISCTKGGLRRRLMIILGVLWVGNWVYR